MGVLRLFLAFSVLVNHLGLHFTERSTLSREHLHTVTGGHAVFAFFIISGFYMSLIINEKYAALPDGTRRFYLNRILRIYPSYYVALLATVIFGFFSGHPTVYAGYFFHPIGRWIAAIVTNTVIFGSEILPSIDASNGNLDVVGPVWTLSVELYFYCLAPFIVRRSSPIVLGMMLVALVFRLTLAWANVPISPFRYYYFPSNIVFFLIGCVSYKIYAVLKSHPGMRTGGIVAALCLLAYLKFFPVWYDIDGRRTWGFFSLIALSVPFLFALTKSSAIDRALGNLSYPVYVIHSFVCMVLVWMGIGKWTDPGIATVAVTLVVSVLLHRYLEKPIENMRALVSRGADGVETDAPNASPIA